MSVKCERIVFDFKRYQFFFGCQLKLHQPWWWNGSFSNIYFSNPHIDGQYQKGGLILPTLNKGDLGMPHPVRWGLEYFLFNPIALNLLPLVKSSKKGFPYTCKIYSWTRIGWPIGTWLLSVSWWTTHQKPFLVRILINKNGITKRILREDKKKGSRKNSRLPKKHLFYSRPEVPRTTLRRYKIS